MIIEHPLFYTLITLVVFYSTTILYKKIKQPALLHPMLVSIFILGVFLSFSEIPYSTYKNNTEILHVFLDPAIVALAIPLFENLKSVKKVIPLLLTTVILGGSFIILSALTIGASAGLDTQTVLSLTTKSVSAPIALNISDIIGSNTSMTILAVFATGIPGVILTPTIFKLLNIKSDMIKGFTFGMTSHAFGVARSSEISNEAAAYATLGMGLMGCISAILIPTMIVFFV